MRTLIIIESKNKVETIKQALRGTEYENAIIMPSNGHIIEIKDGGKYCNCGIDPNNNFKANYQIAEDKKNVVKDLKEQVRLADRIFICSDPDREGEFIAWSLVEFLNIPKDKYKRATFHEITKKALLNGLNNATDIDYNFMDSADARRKMDKIIGYRFSPYSKKYLNARSVGRVQSAGLMLIVDREKEIQAFVPEEYWELYLHFEKQNTEYKAKYIGTTEKKKEKISLEDIDKVIKSCYNKMYRVSDIVTKEKQTTTKPPFTTSTFQQEVSSKLGISVEKSMQIAQKLFEGISIKGEHIALITYLRTDSDNMAEDFQVELKQYIKDTYGTDYLGTLKQGKKKSNVQEGHECLRCVDLSMTADKLSQFIDDKVLLKVYDIIYKRTVASMMKPEIISETTYVIENNGQLFNLVSREQLFDGYKKVYTFDKDDDNILKVTFAKDEVLLRTNLEKVQKFTQPPARFSDATFVKEMENTGIGRPSTFATVIKTLIDPSRGYCVSKDNKLIPVEKGVQVTDFLIKEFPTIFNIHYTSEMEEQLDKIENGTLKENDCLRDFYNTVEENINNFQKTSNYAKKEAVVADNVKCPLCGNDMYVRTGRFGDFYGCSQYPKCKGVVKIEKENKSS